MLVFDVHSFILHLLYLLNKYKQILLQGMDKMCPL